MKIAVLLFGHLRDFEKCADSLNENLLNQYEGDVFIHTWDELDHNSKSWHEQRFEASHVDETIMDVILAKYHPKGLVVEHQEKYAEERIIQLPFNPDLKISSAIPYFMFYSMNKANQLRIEYEKKNGITYDFVFVTRPDVRLKTPFDLDYYLNWIKMMEFDMEACRFFGSFVSGNSKRSVISTSNDLFFFAKPNVIDKYIEINKVLNEEEIRKYGETILSIFTAKEIRNGIMPIPLTYILGADWDYSNMRIQEAKQHQKRQIKAWKKVIFGIGAILLYPVFQLQKKYRLLNYHEFRKELIG